MKETKHKNPGGFTLVEALMATVALGIAASSILLPFTTGARVQTEGTRMTLGSKLAGDLLEKIISLPTDEIVSTYDGYTEPAGQIKDAGEVVFTDANYAYFSRQVSCQLVRVAQQADDAEPVFIRVTVTVYYRGRQIAEANRLVSK